MHQTLDLWDLCNGKKIVKNRYLNEKVFYDDNTAYGKNIVYGFK